MFTNIYKAVSVRIAIVLALLFGVLVTTPARASVNIIYVKSNASGANNGTSWTNAFTSLQSALAAAASGNEIWVAAGTYKPTTNTDRSVSFVLKNAVSIYGGFAGTETQRAQRNIHSNVTVLSGDIGAGGDSSDNSYHVVFGNGLGNTTQLNGFTITGGNANGGLYPFSGGGMLNKFSSSPILADITFTENTAYDTGGGMATYDDSNPQLINIIFAQNSAVGGGGLYSRQGKPVLTNVTFDGNEANTGGGYFSSNDTSILNKVTFSNNHADGDGGGLAGFHTFHQLKNVTFSGNTAGHLGGGMSIDYHSQLALNNVTLADNTSSFKAGGLSITGTSDVGIANSIFWNNTAPNNGEIYTVGSTLAIATSVIKGGCPTGTTCSDIINSDPKLGALADYGGFTETRALLQGSSAIDEGYDASCPDTDQRGVHRPQGAHCDIGAYEASNPATPILLSPLNNAITGTLQPALNWKPSNPDVSSYQIQISLSSTFTTTVFDVSGLSSPTFTPASNLDPGVKYFWRVRAVNGVGTISNWAAAWNFRTPLAVPSLVSPTNGESLLVNRPSFDWDAVSTATGYTLQVSATHNFTTFVVNATVNSTEYTVIRDLPRNTTLYWRVNAKNSVSASPWSEIWSFVTGNPPSVPVLVAPGNNALVRDYTPMLDWNNSTVFMGATLDRYEIEVDDDTDFSSPVITDTQTVSDYTPISDLASNTQYYWRVRAVGTFNSNEHISAWSAIRSFRTALLPPQSLTAVQTSDPARPSFEWDAATGPGVISGYTIQVALDERFGGLLLQASTAVPSYTMLKDLPIGRVLYCRVRVNGVNGPSQWSETVSFTLPLP